MDLLKGYLHKFREVIGKLGMEDTTHHLEVGVPYI